MVPVILIHVSSYLIMLNESIQYFQLVPHHLDFFLLALEGRDVLLRFYHVLEGILEGVIGDPDPVEVDIER